MSQDSTGIDTWTATLTAREIPVLKQTVRALEEARAKLDKIGVRDIAAICLRDPLMTLRVLRFCMCHRARRQLQDIDTVEHAVMMLGVEPFFHHFARFEVIEDRLKASPQALLGLLQVIRRAQRAARFAQDWAIWRVDLNNEEIAVAALLHDLAEILLWCEAPDKALEIASLQKSSPGVRSATAQNAVLGFALIDLQRALCVQWGLPELLKNLMDDHQQDRPRVRNVKLAVDLARHTANGWDDPALPDDFAAIASLMNIDHDTLMARLGLQSPAEDGGA